MGSFGSRGHEQETTTPPHQEVDNCLHLTVFRVYLQTLAATRRTTHAARIYHAPSDLSLWTTTRL